jgi:hypothetical protein
MTRSARRALLWTPRVLSILFALFLAVFALDVFSEDRGAWETVAALILHLIPSFLVLALLAVSWRREWIGGVVFLLFGFVYLLFAWGRGFHWTAYLAISGSLFLMGILFLASWKWGARFHAETSIRT